MLSNSERFIQNNHGSHSVSLSPGESWCCHTRLTSQTLCGQPLLTRSHIRTQHELNVSVSSSDLISSHESCVCCSSNSNKPACAAHTHRFFPTLHFSPSYPSCQTSAYKSRGRSFCFTSLSRPVVNYRCAMPKRVQLS